MSRKPAVDLFIPCFVDQFYPETGFNMVKILEKLGCRVSYNQEQTCCGQPAFTSGFVDEAQEVAVKFLSDFSTEGRYVVAPSASCVGMVRNSYSHLFNGTTHLLSCRKLQKNIFELSEFLTGILKTEKVEGARLSGTAVFHDSCSGLRECGIKEGPRKLLRNVLELKLVEMKDAEVCCGFGGTFAVKFEPISVAMAQQKVENALEAGADIIVTTDASCLMQLQGYIRKNKLSLRVMHLADVLASGW